MLVQGVSQRTISAMDWPVGPVRVIDQRLMPHEFRIVDIHNMETMALAIEEMWVRGAPLIGASAAWGMALAAREGVERSVALVRLGKTRPTAVNLHWALRRMDDFWKVHQSEADFIQKMGKEALRICDEDVESCQKIGQYGLTIFKEIYRRKGGGTLNILTHCNAGWLACVDVGTATAPIYAAHAAGIPIHVWVDETRPRNQGAKLTAWELGQQGIPHTLIVDNAGGHLMQHGQVDVVIVGADRVTATGDVANKIGTYLKALAAKDNGVPFWVAFPFSTLDMSLQDGIQEIPIEERNHNEVLYMDGQTNQGNLAEVRICPTWTTASNFGFDVTPARLITGIITEKGSCAANAQSILRLDPQSPSDGVIRFLSHYKNRQWIAKEFPSLALREGRQWLHALGVIGVGEDQVGFGNISERATDKGTFFITGSQTGHLSELAESGYSKVTHVESSQHTLWCEGPSEASSESMTHAALYTCHKGIGAVAHGHHHVLWEKLCAMGAPATSEEIEYGTPEMAVEVQRAWQACGGLDTGFLVMKGHKEGVLTWAPSVQAAVERWTMLLRGFGLLPRGVGETLTWKEVEDSHTKN